LNICKTPGATERDYLTWCRQHAFIAPHADTNDRYLAAAQKRIDDTNPIRTNVQKKFKKLPKKMQHF